MAHNKGLSRPSSWGRKLRPLAILLGPRARWVVGPLLVVLLLWVGLRFAWQNWGRQATSEEYRVTASGVTVTPQPAWIHSDVRAEAVRAGGLEGLSLNDPRLVEHVQRAFALSGWVKSVQQVRKRYPAEVVVDVEYRRPVAMVEVNWRGQPSLYFIDEDSVLLPKEDDERTFEQRQQEYKGYLRINAGEVSAGGRIAGQPWGDAKIAGAARLAALGQKKWLELGVQRIIVVEDLNAQPLYELETSAARIVWGSAPGAETSGEPNAAAKWKRLLELAAKSGSLDASAAQQRIDLRTLPPQAPARTATAPDTSDGNQR